MVTWFVMRVGAGRAIAIEDAFGVESGRGLEVSDTDLNADQIRRAVIQQLENQRRSGVTHWKRIAAKALPPVDAPVNSPSVRQSRPAPTEVAAPLTRRNPDDATHVATNVNLFGEVETPEVAKKKSIAAAVSTPRPPFVPLDLPLADRVRGLAELQERVRGCTRCKELACTRTQTVFGVGNPQAKILFVGEAPGADEDAQGEPFVGRSGQLLNDIIKACGLKREDIYICNILRCRPPGNRLPAPDEAANCREYLDGQIAHVNPDYIVCWGACAAQNLLGSMDSIGKMRGQFFTYGRAKVACTYHPSYLLRNPAAKKDVWEDMKRIFLDMGIDLRAKKPSS